MELLVSAVLVAQTAKAALAVEMIARHPSVMAMAVKPVLVLEAVRPVLEAREVSLVSFLARAKVVFMGQEVKLRIKKSVFLSYVCSLLY
jgi:hypothetical protein